VQFGLEWHAALESGKVYNALDACAFLGISAVEMDKQWGITKKADKLVKFGGGFYCGLVELAGKDPIYVFNGFFMEMRAKYTTPGLSIHYYSVEWDADTLSWADFRGSVLGPTDPAEGPRDSARGQIYEKWESLGLEGQPNVGDNGVHASASPFEALAERCNWLGADFATDPYGAELVAAGVPVETLKAWSVDPQVRSQPHGRLRARIRTRSHTSAGWSRRFVRTLACATAVPGVSARLPLLPCCVVG
jgi:hypothetical protein